MIRRRIIITLDDSFIPLKASILTDTNKDIVLGVQKSSYPGGERRIVIPELLKMFKKIEHPMNIQDIIICARIKSPSDLIDLILCDEIVENFKAPYTEKILICPYFPYAREDKRSEPGVAFSLKAICNLINHMNFSCVKVLDPHSGILYALLNNVQPIPRTPLWYGAVSDIAKEINTPLSAKFTTNTRVIVPDYGAVERTNNFCKAFNSSVHLYFNQIQCSKERDPNTGKLSGFKVHATANQCRNKHAIIVDDICDGGGTFIGLAKELDKLGFKKKFLIVSHGIFSQGYRHLFKYYDKIYTTDSWQNFPTDKENPKFKFFTLKNFLL